MAWVEKEEIPFDRDAVIEEVEKQLPSPWKWFTIGESNVTLKEWGDYHFLITRIKEVNELVKLDIPVLGPRTQEFIRKYNIVIGVTIGEYTTIGGYVINDCNIENTIVSKEIKARSLQGLCMALTIIEQEYSIPYR